MVPDALRALHEFVAILDGIGAPFVIGGSIASGAWGEPRTTHDVDLLAQLREEQVAELVRQASTSFYIDAVAVREALAMHRAFNVVHLTLFQKIDVFVASDGLLDRLQLERRSSRTLHPELPPMYVTSPEIVVLRKLDWFRKSDGALERQMRDVVSVLKVQARTIDVDFLRRTAHELALTALLERALRMAAPQAG